MDPERWKKVEHIYNSALERKSDLRQAFLDGACAGDSELRREVDSLLACRPEAEGFIDAPAIEQMARQMADSQAHPAAPDLAGRTLLHYRVDAKIGQGGMGVVYKAWDTHLNRFVAIKVLPLDKMADPERRQRFIQEAKAASALNHPNIITIHDIARQDDIDFMVMEYISGKTLDESIGRRGLRLNPTLKYAIQIADALARAHRAGIVHRDLKPSNVMIDEHGLVKVLDFGLAKLTEKAAAGDSRPTESIKPYTDEGMILGTVAYMSPEQAEARVVDARSDIFSFGSLLYEMASGRRAFEGESHMSTLSAILRQDPKPLEGLPADLEKLIARCLRKDPARRFQHMDDVKVALEDLKEESDSGKLLAEPPELAKKRPGWLCWTKRAAAVLILLLGVGLWTWLKLRPQPAMQAPSTQGPVLTRLTSDSGLTTEPALSPDGKLLVYASDRSGEGNLDLWVQQVPGGQPVRLTHEKADAREPSFSPDGTKVVYSSARDGGGIYVIQALGAGDPRKVAGAGRNPRFSPDGTGIVYWSGISGGSLLPFFSYVVTASGGTPERLAPDFTHTCFPEWLPDGNGILLFSYPPMNSPRPAGAWIVPGGGGEPVRVRMQTTAPKTKISIVAFSPHQWLGDRILFSARLGDSINLWENHISQQPWQFTGEPRRLTFGAGEDLNPCLAGGRLVFSTVNTNIDIWSLPLDTAQGKVLGDLKRLTRDASVDHSPSISADGKKVVFWSTRSGKGENWIKDLESEKESLLIGTAGIGGAWISSDGTKAAYAGPSKAGDRKIQILDLATNIEREVNAAAQRGPWDISTRRNKILISADAQPRNLIAIDADSAKESVCVPTSKHDLYNAHFSPDDAWIVLVAIAGQGPATRLFIVPYREGNPPEETEWIPISDGLAFDDHPRWSPDGGMIYFTSNRDRHRCLWAQRVDMKTRKPLGDPISIYHFHQAALLMQEKGGDPLQIGVARDKIVFNLRHSTGNIWMTPYP